MTDKLISALTTASSAVGTDMLVLNQDQGGSVFATKAISVSNLKASLFASPAFTGSATVAGDLVVGGTTNTPSGKVSVGTAINSGVMYNGRWDQNGNTYILNGTNSSSGTSADVIAQLSNGTNALQLHMFGASWTTTSIFRQAGGLLLSDGPGGLTVNTQHASGSVYVIAGGGSGGVQLSPGATSWSGISDYRAKNDYGVMPGSQAVAIVRGTPIHLAALKYAPEVIKPMFLAHELQAQAPYAVCGEKDGAEMQRIESTDPLVPILWSALNAALERIEALEAA